MMIVKSVLAILAGLVFIVVSHTVVDSILEATGIFPPPSEGLFETWKLFLAFSYRLVLSIAGCYITAWLAPRGPLMHGVILGVIGLIASTAAAVAVIPLNWSPVWYPIAVSASALPAGWIGGKLREKQIAKR